MDQKQLAEQFGVSNEEMDKILTKCGLKSNKFVTQKALESNCVWSSSDLESPIWNPIKVSELTGRKLKDEIGFHADQVMHHLQIDSELGEVRTYALLLSSQAYQDVPEERWDEVKARVERKIVGERKNFCENCGRRIFFSANSHCWRCHLEPASRQGGLEVEASIHENAAELTEDDWEQFYVDHNLERKETDKALWNAAMDAAIEAYMSDDPICLLDDEAVAEFVYRGHESQGLARCAAFLSIADRILWLVG